MRTLMTPSEQKMVEDFERTRRICLETQKITEEPRYVAVRLRDDKLTFGTGSVKWVENNASEGYRLHEALYYEIYDDRGVMVKAMFNDVHTLLQYGGDVLPLGGPCLHTTIVANPVECDEPTLGPEGKPLWWEIERKSQREQQEAIIALRNEVRRLTNYD